MGKCGKMWENVHILWTFGIFYGHVGYFMAIWFIPCSFGTFLSGFGIMHREKSGNPAAEPSKQHLNQFNFWSI
jgi:hypothetical protein